MAMHSLVVIHLCSVLLFCSVYLQRVNGEERAVKKFKGASVEDHIRKFGYPVEAHEITTEDGYILTYHRIPHGKSHLDKSVKRKPLLLQHGIICSSSVWILSSYSFAYLLADAGFDVWLGNARGNNYSRKHIKYDPDIEKKKFWDFSWHEMGYYDLPASIDYILKVTRSNKLLYIGHSMGAVMMFVMGATRPEYMDKVEAIVAMAPVAIHKHTSSITLILFLRTLPLVKLFSNVDGEMLGYSHSLSLLTHVPGFPFIIRYFLYTLSGFSKGLDLQTTTKILQFLPGGTSYKLLYHIRQIYAKDFREYDYGEKENKKRYGSVKPPLYKLSNVRAPTYVYYSANDLAVTPLDVEDLVKQLPNVRRVIKVPDDQFSHVDFMWANNAKPLLYDDVIALLHELNKK